ncbi:MAG: HAMP domain-containing protein [Nitrospirae bacterium]|nr:MAG: HAMP domain-containing protein [Nitrospirota bacterium]
MRTWRFDGILSWVMITGIIVVGLTIVSLNLLDRYVIEEAAAHNLHFAFLRASAAVSRILSNAGDDIHDVKALNEAFQDIFELRPALRRLSVYEVTPDSGALTFSSDPSTVPPMLSEHERSEIAAGRSLTRFEGATTDRAWVFIAPILVKDRVVGALRGRFSIGKYDRLIKQERELAKDVGVAAVSITCLVFLALIRMKVHRPISRLLYAIRRAEAGDLTSQAPIVGPSDIQEVANQFNRMLDRVREAIAEKEHLLGEIRSFNDTLMTRISEATEELRRTNATLVETRSQAERAEKLAALGELSAVVAHELGNPLNAMCGHLQLLAKATDPKAHERHLTIIRSEIERMVGILHHILDSTRVQIQSVPVDLNKVIDEVLTLLSPGLHSRRIVVKTDLMPHLPHITGDRRAVHGMLFNLVTNAINAMPKGGELEIKTCQTMNERVEGNVVLGGVRDLSFGAIRLTIQDTGQGIPPEHLGNVFKPFFTTRQGEGGTGLGLAICHRVVTSIGGQLAVQSTVGHGTLFTIDLPIWREERLKGESNGQ